MKSMHNNDEKHTRLRSSQRWAAAAAAATKPTAAEVPRSGQGEAAASATGATAARIWAAAAVGLPPQSSLSSHMRGSSLLSIFK